MKRLFGFLAIALGIAILLFLRITNDVDLPRHVAEVFAAIFGSIITIMITALLLRTQSTNEVDRDKSIGIFNAKLDRYSQFCEFLNHLAAQEEMSPQHEHELQLWAMKLSLVSGEEVSDSLDQFFLQSHRFGKLLFEDLTEQERGELLELGKARFGKGRRPKDPANCFMSIGELISHLKHDLGEAKISSLNDVASCRHAIDDILLAGREKTP